MLTLLALPFKILKNSGIMFTSYSEHSIISQYKSDELFDIPAQGKLVLNMISWSSFKPT